MQFVKREIVLDEDYFQWKKKYRKEQLHNIADLHYKINLLSNFFHQWRVHCLKGLVKKRMLDLARIHYEDKLASKTLKNWKDKMQTLKNERKLLNIQHLKQAFKKWKEFTSLSRLLTQRKINIAKTIYQQVLLRRYFSQWKINHHLSKAEKLYDKHQKRRVFKLWKLQILRRKLQRRLARAHFRKVLQQRLFYRWRVRWHGKEEKKLMFKKILMAQVLKVYMERWKAFYFTRKRYKHDTLCFNNSKRLCNLQTFFCTWKQRLKVKHFSVHHKEWQEGYLQRKYYAMWKGKVKERKLEEMAMASWPHIQEKLLLKRFYTRWKAQNTQADILHKKVDLMRCVVNKRYLHTCLYLWRLVTQEELLIKPILKSHEKKIVEKCFAAWYSVSKLNLARKKRLKSFQQKRLSIVFDKWRTIVYDRNQDRRVRILEEEKIVLSCINRWKAFVAMKRSQRSNLLERFARHWLDVTQQRKLEKDIKHAKKVNEIMLQKVYLNKWMHQAQLYCTKRVSNEGKAMEYERNHSLSRSFFCWVKKYRVILFVRKVRQQRETKLLRKAFISWIEVVRYEFSNKIARFNQKLMLDSSFINSFGDRALTSDMVQKDTASDTNVYKRSNRSNNRLEIHVAEPNLSKEKQYLMGRYTENLEVLPKNIVTGYDQDDIIFNHADETLANDDELADGYTLNGSVGYDTELMNDYSTLNTDGLNTSRSNFHLDLTCCSEESKFIHDSKSPTSIHDSEILTASWIDHWKRRFRQSKRTARQKRSLWFQPMECSTICSLCSEDNTFPYIPSPCPSCSNSSIMSSSSLIVPPKKPDILNRTLPFVRRSSCDDINTLMTSGVYSLATTEEDIGSIDSRTERRKKSKEYLLVGTIKHWQNVDMSLIFYAWYKHTARKKMLKESQEFLMAKREEYQLHSVFLHWNKQLFVKQAVAEFQWKKCIGPCFTKLKEYAALKRWKYENNQLACSQYRRKCLTKFIFLWNKKLKEYHVVHEITKHWLSSSVVNDYDQTKIKMHQKKRDSIILRTRFTYWKNMKEKHIKAMCHYENTLLNRSLNTWWFRVMLHESRKKKLVNFRMQHTVKQYFTVWKRKCFCMERVKDFQSVSAVYENLNDGRNHTPREQAKTRGIMRAFFTAWLSWSREQSEHNVKEVCFSEDRMRTLLRDAFEEWKVHHHQVKMAEMHYQRVISRKIMCNWILTLRQRKEKGVKLKHHLETKKKTLIRKNFKRWEQLTASQKKFHEKATEQKQLLLRETFTHWRKSYLSKKSLAFQKKHLILVHFTIWKKAYVSKNKDIQLFKHSSKKWLSFVQASRTHEKNLSYLLDIKKEIAVNECFLCWKEQTNHSLRAKQHFGVNLKARIFKAWHAYSTTTASSNKILQERLSCTNKKLLSSAFHIWSRRYLQNRKLLQIKENLQMINAQKLAKKWLIITKINRFKNKRSHKLQAKVFTKWLCTTRNNAKAEKFLHQSQKKRFFENWLVNTGRTKEMKHQCMKFKMVANKRWMKSIFLLWKEKFQDRKLEKEHKSLAAEDHHGKVIKKKAFERWRINVVLCKRRTKLARKYAQRWKEIVAMNHLAISMYHQKLYNKSWMLWRRSMIQNQVSVCMKEQDERRLLSEVFLAWFDYMQIKRTFPEQYDVTKKKLWFRRWMKVYNNS